MYKLTEEVIQHYGVLGMKWGRRKADSGATTGKGQSKDSVVKKATTRVKDEWNSKSRERHWSKALKDMDSMTPQQLNNLSKRIQMENDLKRLSKNKGIANKQDKKDYRDRADLSDAALQLRLQKLRAKDNLYRNVREASREQREMGMRLVRIADGVSLKYATTGALNTKDIGLAVLNSKKSDDVDRRRKAIETFLDNNNRTVVERKRNN